MICPKCGSKLVIIIGANVQCCRECDVTWVEDEVQVKMNTLEPKE